MRCTGTDPVWPRSGARKIGTPAAGPAFSTRSPIRTTSEVTVTSSFSRGALDCGLAAASWPSARRSARAVAMRIMALPQRIRLEVACSIWSAALMTLPFIS